jgi:hypothetical protein
MSIDSNVINFPSKPEPWMTPQDNFECDAVDFVWDSPAAWDLVERLRSCRSPFMRAAIIYCACSAEDHPFLLRIAETALERPSRPSREGMKP